MVLASRVALLSILACISSIANAELKLNVDYKFYSISPHHESEIIQELNSKSPIRKEGRVAHGITRVNLQWRPVMLPRSQACELTGIEAQLSLLYTLPQLELSTPNSELKTAFDTSYEVLHTHELGHGELAIQAAKAIESQLVGMTHSEGCAALEQQAIATAKQIYAHYKKMELEYDKLTDHGRQQSAVDTPIPAPNS
ncbi:MAG: DUF922 domain-containing protein [Pseudohongiellaceae bacterium]|nr:DUF922 domain-containing protein [Pseudohongiellaceae bacterium]